MVYCSTSDVYRTSGITSSVVPIADVSNHIIEAEAIICRLTKNIYWERKVDLGVSSATDDTLTRTGAGWTANEYAEMYVWVYSGTGEGQLRSVLSNTTDTLTIDRDWTTNPDNTSSFRIFYVPSGFDPYIQANYDGNQQKFMYLPYFPVKVVESLVVNDVTVTVSNLYIWEKTGRIELKSGAEASYFLSSYPQSINIKYWYGVDFVPYEIKRLVELKASIQILNQQMGGTYNVPSTVSLPEINVTIGQAYVNIRGAIDILEKEYNQLLSSVVKIYPIFG